MGHIDDEEPNPERSNTTTTSTETTTRRSNDGGIFRRHDSIFRNVETTRTDDDSSVLKEHWFVNHWRPGMAWLYFSICAFDFICAPIFTFWFAYATDTKYVAWAPITLQGGGLIHISLGAIIGIYTWSRSQEKMAGAFYRRELD